MEVKISESLSRVCKSCGDLKVLSDFVRRRGAHLGYQAHCKKCHALKARQRRKINPRAVLDTRQRYEAKHSEISKANKAKEARTPTGLARSLVRVNVYRGTLVKPSTCSECGVDTPKEKLSGHHKDYSKPLDVVWLCYKCHGRKHRKYA